uniref:Uncharacterized protein n=1 Tax=Oryza sativa subsp. indica TaxID=39946 RepID=C5NNT0_ORYSI|nr:hypothetical protein [Oryza sativa Indica Group]
MEHVMVGPILVKVSRLLWSTVLINPSSLLTPLKTIVPLSLGEQREHEAAANTTCSAFTSPPELAASIVGRPSLLCVRRRTWLDGHDANDQDDGPFTASTASTREAEKGRGKLAGFPDDLCLAGPHGVLCDDGDASHIVGISLGYVSDFSANPSSAAPSAFAATSLPLLCRT